MNNHEKRDAELDAALADYLQDLIARGYTKEQAVEMIRQRIHSFSVYHRRSQIKLVP